MKFSNLFFVYKALAKKQLLIKQMVNKKQILKQNVWQCKNYNDLIVASFSILFLAIRKALIDNNNFFL